MIQNINVSPVEHGLDKSFSLNLLALTSFSLNTLKMNTKSAQKLSACIKRNVLNQKDIDLIHAIGQEKYEIDQKTRGNELNADGHSVTFLQQNRVFEKQAPKLLKKITDIMKECDNEHWKLIESEIEEKENVNYRVIEYHRYIKGGGLLRKDHFDGGSIMTCVLMLSDPEKDFEGGQLMTWECDHTFKMYSVKQEDMLCFPSHKYHSVSTVTKLSMYLYL